MILVSFCRILNGLSDEINLFWCCSSPIKGVKGRKKVTKATKEKMQKELDVLEKLKLPPSEKSVLPAALQILDEGRLTFFRPYLIPAPENID